MAWYWETLGTDHVPDASWDPDARCPVCNHFNCTCTKPEFQEEGTDVWPCGSTWCNPGKHDACDGCSHGNPEPDPGAFKKLYDVDVWIESTWMRGGGYDTVRVEAYCVEDAANKAVTAMKEKYSADEDATVIDSDFDVRLVTTVDDEIPF